MKIENKLCQNKANQQRFEDRTTEITIEELRELHSFSNYTEAQAKNLIDTMKSFARIIYNMTKTDIDNPIFEHNINATNILQSLNKAA